jgi:hypothetical protein
MGQFLGFSKLHSSSVGLIRNLQTGHISPQYHVIYDQTFDTVTGGMQERAPVELTADTFHLYLRSKWDGEDRINALSDWDPQVDGELPNCPLSWDEETQLDTRRLASDVDYQNVRFAPPTTENTQPDSVRRRLNFDNDIPLDAPPSPDPLVGGEVPLRFSPGVQNRELVQAINDGVETEDDVFGVPPEAEAVAHGLGRGEPPPGEPLPGEPLAPALRRTNRQRIPNRAIYNDSFQSHYSSVRSNLSRSLAALATGSLMRHATVLAPGPP